MIPKNLQFFDYNGYNLNFEWVVESNSKDIGHWEGTIYLPKVSVGLYANTSIYILEKIGDSFYFPQGNRKIEFYWDKVNKFVDEFFLFNFDESYVLKDTSSLKYIPNDGPDCETLIVNTFDRYEINLESANVSKALPIHIGFMADEKFDATTYNRTLIMSYNDNIIAKIKLYAETIEEDERLKIWNDNLGYNITPEDTIIFDKSDLNEFKPNYKLLNEKRKELMLEGSNIYPYIGSYKAIINAIKFFGYENLNIIEYWKNVNPNDENFGKIYHSSKYSLTHKETLRIGTHNIILPNKDYKKINSIALVYSINQPTGEIDEWELPIVKEKFTYTIEEALIKLFALRKKLNKEFMPGSSRIVDIIGEASYFGIQSIRKIYDTQDILIGENDFRPNFEIENSNYIHITDTRYVEEYILQKNNYESFDFDVLDNLQKCTYYTSYYNDVIINKKMSITANDIYSNVDSDSDSDSDVDTKYSAKVILSNTSFEDISFGNCELKFGCKYSILNGLDDSDSDSDIDVYTSIDLNADTYKINGNPVNFGNINELNYGKRISWKITMSKNQYDEDLKNVNIIKQYPYKEWCLEVKNKPLAEYNRFFAELPYVGYYDVTMDIDGIKKTKMKCIKVEPYNIELIGFYFDARNLPEHLQYENGKETLIYQFIDENITNMINKANSEKTQDTPVDQTISPGPYFNDNLKLEWYADNLTPNLCDILNSLTSSDGNTLVEFTRYIKNGVDVKPYTWFLLGYDHSKIVGAINPRWTIKNNEIPKDGITEIRGNYLTLLLKKEGNYTVTLNLDDELGNSYEISRNIIVVDKKANYKLYQSFKTDYDFMIEQSQKQSINEYYLDDKEDTED